MKTRPLAGGRAPRSWLRGLRQAAAPLRGLRRASAWLGELAGTRPRLRHEPLFGRSLGELALREAPAARPEAEGQRAARARDDSPGERSPRRLRGAEGKRSQAALDRNPPAGPVRRGQGGHVSATASLSAVSPAPLRLPEQASRDLLARQAGEVPDFPGVVHATPPLPRPGRLPDEPALPADAPRRRREWLRDLARRGIRALRGDLSGTAVRPAPRASPAGSLRREKTPDRAADFSTPTPPAEPWGTPLDGEQAPSDLLLRWSAPPPVPSGRPPAPRTPERPREPSGPDLPRERPSPAGASPAVQPASQAEASPAATAPPRPGPAADSPAAMELSGLPVSQVLDAALPPLFPGRPSAPWRATAAVPALVGRPEAEIEGEDLERLAINLKRILDEEARRHGIDV